MRPPPFLCTLLALILSSHVPAAEGRAHASVRGNYSYLNNQKGNPRWLKSFEDAQKEHKDVLVHVTDEYPYLGTPSSGLLICFQFDMPLFAGYWLNVAA